MFQLQCIWTYGKRMQETKEGKRDEKMLQVQQSRTLSKRLQVQTENEDQEKPRRVR